MTPKFTPGPWEAKYNGHYWDIEQRNVKKYNAIASTNSWVDSHDRKLSVAEVEEANARLIAAAPEMYEAIVKLLACTELNLDELEGSTICAIKEAEFVLQKARGE